MITSKWLPIWLLTLSLTSCVLNVLIHHPHAPCAAAPWLCHQHAMARDFWMMATPLMVLVVRGVAAGGKQLYHTRVALRQIRSGSRAHVPAYVTALARRLGIDRHLDVIVATNPEAFCYGLFRPRICLTSGLIETLSASELEAVLRHERHHLRCYDPLRVVLWTMVSTMCWWLAEDAFQARLHRELAADRAVIVAQGRTPLASALYKLLNVADDQHGSSPGLAVSGLSVTDARIDQLLRPEAVPPFTPCVRRWLLVPMLLLTLLLCSISMAYLRV